MTDHELVQKIRERLAVIDQQALADFDELAKRCADKRENSPPIPLSAPPEEAFAGSFMDEHDYPTDAALDKIEHWPTNAMEHIPPLFEFVRSLGWETYGTWRETALMEGDCEMLRVVASTGGWAGNESLISALQQNRTAWSLTWQSSKRGGQFVFEIRR